MEGLLKSLVAHLTAEGVVKGDGIDTFRDFTPEKPDDVIVIQEYAGGAISIGEDHMSNRSAQLTVRGKSSKLSRDKAWEIFKVLSVPGRVVNLSSTRVAIIHPRQTPFKMYVDNKDRNVWGFNMGIATKFD